PRLNFRHSAPLLHAPGAVGKPDGHAGSGHRAAVAQCRVTADPDQPARGPLDNQGAELGLAEGVGQVVAPGTSALVDEHHLGSVDRAAGERHVVAFASPSRDVVPQRLTKVVDDVIVRLTAAFEALVNNDSLLCDLNE